MSNVGIWIKQKCSKCPKNPKCEPYSQEMILCILSEINKRERVNPKEEVRIEVVR